MSKAIANLISFSYNLSYTLSPVFRVNFPERAFLLGSGHSFIRPLDSPIGIIVMVARIIAWNISGKARLIEPALVAGIPVTVVPLFTLDDVSAGPAFFRDD